MKVNLNSIGQRVVNPTGVEYTIVGVEDSTVIVTGLNKKGEEITKNLKLSTVEKTFKLIKESKEEAKTLVEEALEEAGISTKLGKIGEKEEEFKEVEESKEVEEAKEVEKEIEEPKEESKEEVKEVITLRDIVEEIVKEKLLILDLEYNPNNTFKNIRKKIRKKATIIKELRLEGYGYTFKVESKEAIKEELLKILA